MSENGEHEAPQSAVSESKGSEVDKLASSDFNDPKVNKKLTSDVQVDEAAVTADRAAHPSSDPASNNGGPTSPEFLIGLLKWHPFMAYFLFLADCNFPNTMPPHERVRGTKAMHKVAYYASILLDYALMLVVLAFLAQVAFKVASNALA